MLKIKLAATHACGPAELPAASCALKTLGWHTAFAGNGDTPPDQVEFGNGVRVRIDAEQADLVVAITGVAGPEPDEDGNPVGLVYVTVASRDGRSRAARHELGKRGKGDICAAAMGAALTLLEELIVARQA